MRVLLIAPAAGVWRHVGRARLFNGRTFRFSLLSLLSVAAETPPGVDIQLVDEQIDDVPWDADVDLVGITCMTAVAPRAYEIADRFRARGVQVVLGGMHPTFMPNEALQHADAVVAGEAEGVWPEVVEAARRGRVHGIYRRTEAHDLVGLKRPRRDLLAHGRYATTHAVQATRGCPHGCAFCSVSAFCGAVQRRRPVEEVAQEVAGIPDRFFVFVDDNLTADREYARALFERLAPLRKRWITQSTLAIADDAGFVAQAAQAGCIGLFVGLESFSEANLGAVNKTCHRVAQYRDGLRLLHSHGIGVEAGVVFGFDGDDPGVFERTLAILDDLRVDLALFSIFTPLPGTPQHAAMKDRILDHNWQHYDYDHAVFQPRRMSIEALEAGRDWITREFYRPWRVARRLAWRAALPHGLATLPYAAVINLAFTGRTARWGVRGWNPARELAAPARPKGLAVSLRPETA